MSLRFVDLFAGLGGFHIALTNLGHKCVFASEIDPELQRLYSQNFGITPKGDIRKVQLDEVPNHDVLCAGFPCQPFSKAGEQSGLDCMKWGDLFDYIARILYHREPRYLILENVPNLRMHDDGRTWKKLDEILKECGYSIQHFKISPHQLSIPQVRERFFIVGSRNSQPQIKLPPKKDPLELSLKSILTPKPTTARKLPKHYIECLSVWQNFLKLYPKHSPLPTFPIWTMEFGATYPFEDRAPLSFQERTLSKYRGKHGIELTGLKGKVLSQALPSYATRDESKFPDWKIDFIEKNRKLYSDNRVWIDRWLPSLIGFAPSLQKLEWNAKEGERDIYKYLLQFRASGIRVRRPSSAPSLIAMTTTQIPAIGWELRYMTREECSKLQSLDALKFLPTSDSRAFKALGNAVNADVVRYIANQLLSTRDERATSC